MRTSDFYDGIVVGARGVGLNFENGKNRRCFLSHRSAGIVLWAVGTLCSVTSACAQSNIAIANPDGQRSRTWQIGGFAGGGFAPNYSIDDQFASIKFSLDFSNAGMEFGRMVTANHGGGPFHGRGEALIELLPFWMAEYPKQMISIRNNINEFPTKTTFGPYSRHGASVTPVLFRWNFMKDDTSRVVPWVQLGGGLLWTNHKFPLADGSTSVINFTP